MSRDLASIKKSVLGGAALLDDVRAFIARFVAFPSDAALHAVTLWAVHTHMAGSFYTSPRLALLSPEPGSGKTRVLEVLALLVLRAMLSFSASPAAIFRTLAVESRTLLFDEIDAVFTKRGKDDGNEDLRALLNVGYRRGATIPRCVGPRHEVQMFDVFSPAVMAGLGDLPDTLMSRAVIIRMRRRSPGERVEQFRMRIHEPEGVKLRDAVAAWAEAHGDSIGDAWPTLPHGVEDRNAEVWEPLLAVADAAGGHWPESARAACLELLKVAADREVSLGIRLLEDLRTVFGHRDAMTTADLLERLNDLDEAPWGDLYGKPLQPRTLARMLKRYDVTSTKVKVDGRSLQGYRREDMWDAWTRYLLSVTAETEPPEPSPGPRGGRTLEVPEAEPAPEPAEPTAPPEVPQVPEPPRQAEPRTRVPDADSARVPEVPLAREPGRPLASRAADLAAILHPLDLESLRDRYRAAAPRAPQSPEWWASTAKNEPVAVTVALELIAEDHQAKAISGPAHSYLTAARAAVEGVTA